MVLLYQSYILNKQYELTVKQQKASALPYILFTFEAGENSFSMGLQNKGLGPAFIKGLYLKEQDSSFILSNLKQFYEYDTQDTLYSYNSSSVFDGIVLAPGEKRLLVSARGSSAGLNSTIQYFSKYFLGASSSMFFIEYESVFEDDFISNTAFENMTKEEYGDFQVYYDLVEWSNNIIYSECR